MGKSIHLFRRTQPLALLFALLQPPNMLFQLLQPRLQRLDVICNRLACSGKLLAHLQVKFIYRSLD